ncbi:MAG: M28 family peptidase [Candidatus Eremiobacteraeota bacterium]|nr:M28 family peptidase [Candidatus Eremiobacteraeota bacterium]
MIPLSSDNSTPDYPPFDEQRAFRLICTQASMGPRPPGCGAHRTLIEFIKQELGKYAPDSRTQPFEVILGGEKVPCENVLGLFKSHSPHRKILIGTHFDTRLTADNERDAAEQAKPIIGANDGGSGTAVMLELARLFSLRPPPCDIVLAFFDAEDVGNIDGNDFYMGSLYFSRHMGDFRPDEVIILDMVGGKCMSLDIDMNGLYYDQCYNLGWKAMLQKFVIISKTLSYRQLAAPKKRKFKYIGCDHIPFLQVLIPAFILIDIDYPQWHTHKDLPEHCSPDSLKAIGHILLEYIYHYPCYEELVAEINRKAEQEKAKKDEPPQPAPEGSPVKS